MSNTAFGPDFDGGKLPSPRKAARERLPLTLYLAVQRIADRELGTLLSQAASEAERVVLAHAGQNIGAKVRRAQLALVMAELRAEQVRLWSKDGPISDALRRQMEEAAAAAAEAHNLLTRVLWNEADGVPLGLESGLVQTARRGIQSIISRTQFRHELSAQVYRTGRATQARIGRLVDQALGRGASWRELAQDVKRFINPTTPGGASYAAKRLARTEINNAFHTTQVRLAVESPFVVGMQWHLSGAHPVPDECNDFDGEVFEPEKVPPKPHAQCMCFTTPKTVSTDEFVDKFVAGEYDEYIRSVQAGYAPEKPVRKPAAEKPPEPAREPEPAAGASRGRLQSFYGERLVVQDKGESVEHHLRQLASLPDRIHNHVAKFMNRPGRGGIYIGDRNVPDLNDAGYLRNERPRGWSEGSTWDQVPGAYLPDKRTLLIGRDSGHGSRDLALHEFGHLADRAFRHVSQADEWLSITFNYRQLNKNGNPYFFQTGADGAEEFFAEMFAAYYAKGKGAVMSEVKDLALTNRIVALFDRLGVES